MMREAQMTHEVLMTPKANDAKLMTPQANDY
jgi:hypothetical protein